MADIVTQTNQQMLAAIGNINIMNAIGWVVFIIILVAAGIYGYIVWNNKRTFNKNVTAFDIVGTYYEPVLREKAKVVKIGTGGFEILYLQKSKSWKIGYGGRVGKKDYYFFIGKDGYWYNGMISANIYAIDKNGGLLSIVTTNPSMRAQYTSLEKQIDTLHSDKKTFMDKYGMWVVGGAFFLGLGIISYLLFREVAPIVQSVNAMQQTQLQNTEKMSLLIDKISQLIGSSSSASTNGLTIIK